MSEGYGKNGMGFGLTRDQSVDMIVRTCIDNGITDHRQIAYVLATAEHESRGFSAPDEDWGRSAAVKNRYFGGEEYFGRGYAHLTHVNNYQRLGERLGMGRELVDDPARAGEPDIATRVLVVGMREGLFAGARLSDHIRGGVFDYRAARLIVNGGELTNGSTAPDAIANLATAWEGRVADLVSNVRREDFRMPTPALPADAPLDLRRGDANEHVFEAQQYLRRLGVRNASNGEISPDGDFGASSEQAVRRFQTEQGIQPVTGHIDQALIDRLRADTLALDPDFKRRTITDLNGPLSDGMLAPGERGEPVFETRLQLEALGYLRAPTDRAERVARTFDPEMQAAFRHFQQDQGLPTRPDGKIDEDVRRQLNDVATAAHHAPTTEFDRPENWPPQRPPFTRAEFQPDQVRARQAGVDMQPAEPLGQNASRTTQAVAVDAMSPRDTAMFDRIRRDVPAEVGDEYVAQAMLASKRNGIGDADQVDRVMMAGDRLWVAGAIPGERAYVDTNTPVSPMEATLRQLQDDNVQRDQQLATDARHQEGRNGPVLG